MNLEDALHHVIDAAKQHRDTLVEAGRLEGAAALLTGAITVVETRQVEAGVAAESRALAAKRRLTTNRPWSAPL